MHYCTKENRMNKEELRQEVLYNIKLECSYWATLNGNNLIENGGAWQHGIKVDKIITEAERLVGYYYFWDKKVLWAGGTVIDVAVQHVLFGELKYS